MDLFLSPEIDVGTDEKQDISFYWPNRQVAVQAEQAVPVEAKMGHRLGTVCS